MYYREGHFDREAYKFHYIFCGQSPTFSQNHNEEGEEGVRTKIAKLSEDMQEQFRKLEE